MATGVQIDDPQSSEGTSTVVGDLTNHSGVVVVAEQKATDERLTGHSVAELTVEENTRSGTASVRGVHELTNAGGSWKGPVYGATDAVGAYAKMVLTGTGGYKGLAAHLQMHSTDAEDRSLGDVNQVWTGWIQKAD